MEYNMREVRYLRGTDPECVRVDLMTELQRGFIDRIGSEGIGRRRGMRDAQIPTL